MTDDLTKALADECERQFENCRDTAVSFITWLKVLRWVRIFFVAAPIVSGALATWKLLADATIPAAIFTLLATVLPPLYRAVKLDDAIKDYEKSSGRVYKPSRPLSAGKADHLAEIVRRIRGGISDTNAATGAGARSNAGSAQLVF